MHQGPGGARSRSQIVVVREICLGHCQRGPSVLTMPVAPGRISEAQWSRPDESCPGARIHHPRTTAQAAALILAESLGAGEAELSVATNPELA